MATAELPLSRVVDVRASISPSAPLRPEFGRTLLITTQGASLRPPNHRTMAFSDLIGVATIVPTTSSLYKKATEYFTQRPYPKDLVIGRWMDTAQTAQILGGTHGTLAAMQALSAGSLTMSGQTASAIDLSSTANFAAVATAVQTAIQSITNPAAWVASTDYVVGNDVSGSDGQIYEALTAGRGIDPISDDGTNWALLGPQVDAATVVYELSLIHI